MKILRYITAFAVLLLAVSCLGRKTGNRYAIAYVDRISSDTTAREWHIVNSFDENDNHGTIAVIGDPETSIRLTEELLTFDKHDNVSGSWNPDGLPDFSGELFAEIMDAANSPYSQYVKNGNEDFLKELNVRNFLSSIDTMSLQSPYDETSSVFKPKSKIVVFSSSYSSEYGCFDVDTLGRKLGKNIPVFDPIRSMVHYVYGRHKGRLNLAVWSDRDKIGNGIYQEISEIMVSGHDTESDYEAFAPAEDTLRNSKHKLMGFLDMYLATGKTEKLTAILLDNMDVNADEINASIKEIVSSDEDNLLIYRNILDENTECVSPAQAIAEQCYAFLRSKNAFTHRIAFPELRCYITAPSSSLPEGSYKEEGVFSDDYKYSRTPDSSESTFSLVELRDRYFSIELMDYMEKFAPKSYSLYVR